MQRYSAAPFSGSPDDTLKVRPPGIGYPMGYVACEENVRFLTDILAPSHVHFFRPFIIACRRAGHPVLVTRSRESLVADLLDSFGIPFRPIAPAGHRPTGLVWELLPRVRALEEAVHAFRTEAMLGVLGTVPITDDGSVIFIAPGGKMLNFHLLDENFEEPQHMRGVVQLQPGEQRSCIGCQVGMRTEGKLDLRAARDANLIPASYRSLITGGWVHYLDRHYGSRHFKAEPLSFDTRQSRPFKALAEKQHETVKLKPVDLGALRAWIDLNFPLWPDYRFRPDRPL